jgi:hypothetical protein
MALAAEERIRALEEMTAEQREELDRRLPEAAGLAPAPPGRGDSDAEAAQVRLPQGHHPKPPEPTPSGARGGGALEGAAAVAAAAEAEAGRIAAMRAFRVVVPSIWSGASDARAFHVKRESASGGALYEMCPYPAAVYGEVNGKVDPSFGPRSLDEIRQKLEEEAIEHRKWGREPEIRPLAIGPFKGFLLETRMRFARGGWSHSGYRDSGTEALGHGWVASEGRTFEVSYGIGSGGCWDNSQRPFQESQTLAALREAQAILAGLRLVPEPGVTQIPYTGPKLDGSDLPVVRLDPPEVGRLNVGDMVIVRAVVENPSPDDRPVRFEWTGEHEGDGGEVLIRATESGTFSLAVTVEGAQYALGSASLTYEVTSLQVRAERVPPSATGPVRAGAEVRLRAVLTADGQRTAGDFVYRWQPDPEVLFKEQDAITATVTARFSEPGRYLVWVQVLRREGEVLRTVIQSEQIEILAEGDPEGPEAGKVFEGEPFAGVAPVPPDSCWHSLNPNPRGWTPMPMAPLHPTTRVTPGNYVVLVGPSGISGKQIPVTWRTFGPFRIEAGHTYGATIKDTGDRLIWERDPLILESFVTAARSDPSAYIYVRNDAFLVDYWHAICVLPVAGAGTDTTDSVDVSEIEDTVRTVTPPFVRLAGREIPNDLLQFGRVLTGAASGRQYFGYTGGQVVLPHREGGTLHFVFWNDQHANPGSTVNRLNVRGGETVVHTVEQYSTALDLKERYQEIPDWGPGGGTVVAIPIPPGVATVVFDSQGSQTGIGLSDLRFDSTAAAGSAPTVVPYVNRTTEVQPQFARVLTGANSGRQYHGHSGGQVVLPHREGGVLSFQLWNDQHEQIERTSNQVTVSIGEERRVIPLTTTREQFAERYREFADWGPAGGDRIEVLVPAGIGVVGFDGSGSQTGIELSGFALHAR